jgi:hypothetical protein
MLLSKPDPLGKLIPVTVYLYDDVINSITL